MRLLLSVAALPFLLLTSNAFCFPSRHVVKAIPSSNRNLLVLFAEDDEYDALLKAYQKKPEIVPNVETTTTSPAKTPEEVLTPAKQMFQSMAKRASAARPIDTSRKAPSLTDLVKNSYESVANSRAANRGGPPTNNIEFDRVANAKEKFSLMSDNYNKLVQDMTETTSTNKAKLAALSAKGKGVGATAKAVIGASVGDAATGIHSFGDLWDRLRVDEFGAWYLLVFAFCFAIVQRNAGREDARKKFEQALVDADEKTMAAVEAAVEKERLKQLEAEARLQEIVVEKKKEVVVKEKKKAVPKKAKVKGATKAKAKTTPTKKKTVKKASKAPKKKAKTVKATKKKEKKAKEPKVTTVSSDTSENPWASLSNSSLMRKTAKALSEYLTERGVTVTDEDGKILKKADLVSAIKSLED